MCSTILHNADENAIGRKEFVVWALGMGMTLNSVQDDGIWFYEINLLRIERRSSVAAAGKCFNIRGEMLSNPEAIDFRELIAAINSSCVRGKLRQWSGGEMVDNSMRLGDDSDSDGT